MEHSFSLNLKSRKRAFKSFLLYYTLQRTCILLNLTFRQVRGSKRAQMLSSASLTFLTYIRKSCVFSTAFGICFQSCVCWYWKWPPPAIIIYIHARHMTMSASAIQMGAFIGWQVCEIHAVMSLLLHCLAHWEICLLKYEPCKVLDGSIISLQLNGNV